MVTPLSANFDRIFSARTLNPEERFEAFQAGGGGVVRKQPLLEEFARLTNTSSGPVLEFLQPEGRIEAVIALLGLPVNWSSFATLRMKGHLTGGAVGIEFGIVGARNLLSVSAQTLDSAEVSLVIDLAELPILAGNRPPHEPVALRWSATWEGKDDSPRCLHLRELMLEPAGDGFSRVCVDRFGQRHRATWPTKLHSEEDLARSVREESEDLLKHPPAATLDAFGGWLHGPKFAPSGFFRVETDSRNKWWFVTPTGRPFWSIGTTGIRLGFATDATCVKNREYLYEELPEPEGPYASAWFEGPMEGPQGPLSLPGNVHFYRWNVLRKWGTPEAWRDHVVRRFQSWGFNTVGSWSDEWMLAQKRLPHTRFLRVRTGSEAPSIPGFADVWDDRWMAYVDQVVAEAAAFERGNPWLLGWFVDNEAPWKNLPLLEMPDGTRLREEWLRLLQERYESLSVLNQVWQKDWKTWEDAQRARMDDVPVEGQARDDLLELQSRFAGQYFSVVASTLKKHDPDHLYLGCRFVRMPPHDRIVAMAGRYCDVVSVNCYSLYPDPEAFTHWHVTASGKPILIGEHHLPLRSQRQFPPLYKAFTTEERRKYYIQFIRIWAEQPFSLGCHWFQHADQPLTGRSTDGENQTVGFVDIADQPHPELVQAAREATANMYAWHEHPSGKGVI